MKKFLIATNLLTLGIIFLQGCLSHIPREGLKNTICSNYSADTLTGLDKDLVLSMVWNYKWNHLARTNMWIDQPNDISVTSWNPLRNIHHEKSDARSIMFDLDKLKKFLWQLEVTAVENGLDRTKLGVRIYYAEYPDTVSNPPNGERLDKSYHTKVWDDFTDLKGLPENYMRKHTVFFIPTYLNADDFPVDFDPRHVVAGRPVPLTEIFSASSKLYRTERAFVFPDYSNFKTMAPPVGTTGAVEGVLNHTAGTSSTKALNHGSLVPPPAASASGANLLTVVDQQ